MSHTLLHPYRPRTKNAGKNLDPPPRIAHKFARNAACGFRNRCHQKNSPPSPLAFGGHLERFGRRVPDRSFTPATAIVDRLERPRIRRQRSAFIAALRTAFRSRSVIPGQASTNANNSGNRVSKPATFPLSSAVVCSAFAAHEPGPLSKTPLSPTFSPVSCPGFCSLSAHLSLWVVCILTNSREFRGFFRFGSDTGSV